MRMGMARWIRLWPAYRQLTAALLAQTTVPADGERHPPT